jgi:hypothetical protein
MPADAAHPAKAIVRRDEKWDQFRSVRARAFMFILVHALVTFVVVVLVLYLVNMLPIKRRGKELLRVVVIIVGVLSLLGVIINF